MTKHRLSDESPCRPAVPLPPALQIEPIRTASAPGHRGLSALATVLISLGLFGGGLFLMEAGQRDYFRTLKGGPKTVRLLLQDDFLISESPGGGGGRGARTWDARADQPVAPALAPAVLRDVSWQPLDELAPLEVPRELPGLQSAPQIPLPSVAGVGTGIGNGAGSGIDNGIGAGSGRGRGGTWIHSASGGEGLQIADSFVGVQDYVHPEYPPLARSARISGDVVIEVTIDENGKPTRWKVVEGHPSLAAATLEVFPRWRFLPVRHQGRRVCATFEVRIRFVLI